MHNDTNKEKLLRNCPLFNHILDTELQLLIKHSSIKQLDRGDFLYKAGNPATHAYVLLMGSAKLIRHHPDGKERIVHILLPGEIVGAAVALQGGIYPISTSILELSQCLEISREAFQSFFMPHPHIRELLMSQMAERLKQAHEDRVSTFDSVEKRIVYFLIDLLNRIKLSFPQTSRITVPLTRQDIADRVGSTVETVIRTLTQLEKQNLILTQNRLIEIPHIKKLALETGIEF
ncbi:Crp/Fnr family transcriptional regulator [bacterium]|nr:Crp/Fnr family transcriptional regulator [bacterium]